VRWLNPRAADAGVLSGMAESGAYARAADLVTSVRDPLAEEKSIIESALWALNFTPQVVLRPFGLLLDVSASLRLFGGTAAIAERLRQGMQDLSLTPALAAAPTATAAWMLAHASSDTITDGDSFIGAIEALPVQIVSAVTAYLDVLESIGCTTIGQLRRLPRAGITRRFGKAVLVELDRAYGVQPEVFAWYEPPESFRIRADLGARIENTEGLLHVARSQLMQMTGWLAGRHAAVSAFSFLLHHEALRLGKAPTTPVTIRLGHPNRDLAHLALLTREHFAKVQLESSVIEMTLQADDIVQLVAPNTELFPTAASQEQSMDMLIERLSARLGAEAIRSIASFPDHRPEQATAVLPVHQAMKHRTGKGDTTMQPGHAPRPAWLLRQPIALLTRQDRPFYQSPLELLIGPERLEGGWFDDKPVTRDYFVAANAANLVLWVYRERAVGDASYSRWFLHGVFA
jgi:protein ImuB